MTLQPTTNATARRAFLSGSEAAPDQLLQLFTPDELLSLIYPPLLATEAALHYADRIADLCAARRTEGTKRTVRALRDIVRTYQRRQLSDLHADVFAELQRHFNLFLEACGGDVQTLWFTVNQELKTRYPHLADYALATEAMVCMSLASYAIRCEARTARLIGERIGGTFQGTSPVASSLHRAAAELTRGLSIDGAPMVELAVRVIDNRMKELEFLLKG